MKLLCEIFGAGPLIAISLLIAPAGFATWYFSSQLQQQCVEHRVGGLPVADLTDCVNVTPSLETDF